MTNKEIMKKLDSMMMTLLKCAIRSNELNCEYSAKATLDECSGIMFSAKVLGLINDAEFDNINNCLSHTQIRWCR